MKAGVTQEGHDRPRATLSIVIPAYNEEGTIAAVVEESFKVLSSLAPDYEVLVGNDGSVDRTREILEDLQRKYARLRVFHHECNRGVGPTCWALYRMARTEWVAFFPGDGQVPPSELLRMVDGLQRFDVVVGLRRHRQDSMIRIGAAWLWNRVGRLLFGLNVRDIDSVKLYPTSLIRSITVESTSPFMETEILIKAVERGLRVGNVDVEHLPRMAGRQTGMRPKVVVGAVLDLVKYWLKHLSRWRLVSRP